jgi:hypothetical protein
LRLYQCLYVEDASLYVASEFSLAKYENNTEAGYTVFQDRIRDFVMLFDASSSGSHVPLVACQSRVLRRMRGVSSVAHEYAVSGIPSCLAVYSALSADDASVVYGLEDGSIGLLNHALDHDASLGWLIEGRRQDSGVECITCADVSESGIADVVVGRRNGTLEVWSFADPTLDAPLRVFHDQMLEALTGVAAGAVTGPGRTDIVATSYTGRAVVFGVHQSSSTASTGGVRSPGNAALADAAPSPSKAALQAELNGLKQEITTLERSLAKERTLENKLRLRAEAALAAGAASRLPPAPPSATAASVPMGSPGPVRGDQRAHESAEESTGPEVDQWPLMAQQLLDVPDVRLEISLRAQDTAFCLSLSAAAALDRMWLYAQVPGDVFVDESFAGVIQSQHPPPRAGRLSAGGDAGLVGAAKDRSGEASRPGAANGSVFVTRFATVVMQAHVFFRPIEGQSGTITLMTALHGSAVTRQHVFRIAPLNLHQRASPTDAGVLPDDTSQLVFTGKFSMAEGCAYLASCFQDFPERCVEALSRRKGLRILTCSSQPTGGGRSFVCVRICSRGHLARCLRAVCRATSEGIMATLMIITTTNRGCWETAMAVPAMPMSSHCEAKARGNRRSWRQLLGSWHPHGPCSSRGHEPQDFCASGHCCAGRKC